MSETAHIEVSCLAEFLAEEMLARGWRTEDVAVRMKTPSGAAMDLFCLDLLMCVQDEGLLIDDAFYAGLTRAFGVDPDCFRNLHQAWLRAYPVQRKPFEAPDELFGPTSRRAMIRVVRPE